MSKPEAIDISAQEEKVTKPLLPSETLGKFSAHHYAPAPGGVDSNLLILLHGLGDSDVGFFNLGKNLQKTLPQTAVLTLQAPLAVPFLDGPHWMWYPTFDQFGEMLTKPNPTHIVQALMDVLMHLTEQCGWPAKAIHLFGFGQGATIALETLVAWQSTKGDEDPKQALGSVVSVAGELISHPTLVKPSPTPVAHIYRAQTELPKESTRWASLRKATSSLALHRLPLGPDGSEESMPRGAEWDAVMQFWSRLFRSRSSWELSGAAVPM